MSTLASASGVESPIHAARSTDVLKNLGQEERVSRQLAVRTIQRRDIELRRLRPFHDRVVDPGPILVIGEHEGLCRIGKPFPGEHGSDQERKATP